ncbi:type I secretion system permease/ATPase [Mongoliimonas terrestris]|uniref:type I secretion system permease/ATPase n=1 Tax=Mongoliimonas terrestris TaxID=1709001 RepID=UPI0009495C1E|nr:type I secretion system permease/ATPase [Mongoliimonas terrestris]
MMPSAFLARLTPARRAFAAAAVASVAANVLSLAGAFYSVQIFDRVFASGSHETLLVLSVLFAGLLLAQGVFERIRGGLMAEVGRWMEASQSPAILRSAMRRQADAAADLRDLATVRSTMTGQGWTAVMDLPWSPLFVAILSLVHPWLGLLAAAAGALLLALTVGLDRWTRSQVRASAPDLVRAQRLISAASRAGDAVEAMGLSASVAATWAELSAPGQARVHRLARTGATVQVAAKVVRLAAQLAGMGLGAYLVLDNHLTAGLLVASSILLARALAPVEQVAAAWRSLQDAREALRRLDRTEAEGAGDKHSLALPDLAGHVAVAGLSLALPGLRRPILDGITFDLEPGQCLGIIGPSGSGKSSLARLLLGLARPSGGEVLLDGLPAPMFDHDRFGSQIGYLPQDVQLLPGTVAQNIARFRPADPDSIVAAATDAGVHALILSLPNGYDTLLQEGGAPLSGGQRQRIALARALYGNPRLLVLDEPDSALDAVGEQALVRTVAALRQRGTTTILIGHRMAAFRTADMLLVLRDGRMERFGPREAVIRSFQARTGAALPVDPRRHTLQTAEA